MGKNINGLDALHQVMRGEITLDKACEGMTDDYEIGHVSHRADGDWRKVAQGKWVPVKAGGQMGAKKEKPYVASGRELEMFKTDASNMSTEQLKYKMDALKGNSSGEPKEFREEKIKIYGDELARRTAGNGDVPLQNRLGSAENHEQMTKVLYDEITRNGKENTVEKLWALYKGEDLGADMQTYIEETGKETGLRGKDACRMVIEKAEEDGAPLREGEKKPEPAWKIDPDSLYSRYDRMISSVGKDIDKAKPGSGDYDMATRTVDNLIKSIDSLLEDQSWHDEHDQLEAAREKATALKDKLNAKNEPAPKAEGGNRQLKRRAEGGAPAKPAEQNDFIDYMAAHWRDDGMTGAKVRDIIKNVAAKNGWDNWKEIEDKVTSIAGPDFDVKKQYDPERWGQISKMKLEDFTGAEQKGGPQDAAPARLTRDTKIKLSQIKR